MGDTGDESNIDILDSYVKKENTKLTIPEGIELDALEMLTYLQEQDISLLDSKAIKRLAFFTQNVMHQALSKVRELASSASDQDLKVGIEKGIETLPYVISKITNNQSIITMANQMKEAVPIDGELDEYILNLAKAISNSSYKITATKEIVHSEGSSKGKITLGGEVRLSISSIREHIDDFLKSIYVILHERTHVDTLTIKLTNTEITRLRDQFPNEILEFFPDIVPNLLGFPNMDISLSLDDFEQYFHKSTDHRHVSFEAAGSKFLDSSTWRTYVTSLYSVNSNSQLTRSSEFILETASMQNQIRVLIENGEDPIKLSIDLFKIFTSNQKGKEWSEITAWGLMLDFVHKKASSLDINRLSLQEEYERSNAKMLLTRNWVGLSIMNEMLKNLQF